MRPTIDQWAMALVDETAKRSTCLRRAVGCVLLDARGRVLSTGYNGVAAGMPHCNEEDWSVADDAGEHTWFPHACPGARLPSGQGLDACYAIHAEQNALMFCRDVDSIHACYVSVSPCMMCVKMLRNTNCTRIVFREEYVQQGPRDIWHGRSWEKFK